MMQRDTLLCGGIVLRDGGSVFLRHCPYSKAKNFAFETEAVNEILYHAVCSRAIYEVKASEH